MHTYSAGEVRHSLRAVCASLRSRSRSRCRRVGAPTAAPRAHAETKRQTAHAQRSTQARPAKTKQASSRQCQKGTEENVAGSGVHMPAVLASKSARPPEGRCAALLVP